jgi:hypothetical protein
MPDGAGKTALAIKLFGKSGAEMIPLLNGGSAALRELGQEADAVGATVSGKTGLAAEQFNDTLNSVSAAIQGLSMKITEAALPALQAIADGLVEATKWFSDLSPEMRQFIARLGLIAIAAGPAIVMLGTVVSSLGTVAAALRGLAALALANPIGRAVAALATGAYLIYRNWAGIKQFFIGMWTAVSDAAAATWEAVKQTWADVGAWFTGRMQEVARAFDEAWTNIKAATAQWVTDFLDVGRQIVEGLKQGIREKWDALVEWFTGLGDQLAADIRGVFGIESPSKVFREIGGHITEGLAIGITDNVPMVDEAMRGLEGAAGTDGLRRKADEARDAFKGMFASIIDGSASAQEALSNLLASFAGKLFDSGFDSLWSALGLDKIFTNSSGNAFSGGRPMAFASGGIVSSPTAFRMPSGLGLMGEAGPEAIMPLTRIGGELGVRAAGGSGVQIHYNIDARGASKGVDELIAEALTRATPVIVRQSVSAAQDKRVRSGRD